MRGAGGEQQGKEEDAEQRCDLERRFSRQHVTETFDRRLLNALGDDIFTLDIVKPHHALSESGTYRCPDPRTFEVCFYQYLIFIICVFILDE